MSMNFEMWRRAVTVMPRLRTDEWVALDLISKWLVSTRFAAIVLTIAAAFLAGTLALRARAFDLPVWTLLTMSLVFAHATNNILNDLVDWLRGIDEAGYLRSQYGTQPLERGFSTVKRHVGYAVANGLLALAGGTLLVLHRGGIALPFMILGGALVLFYSFPLKYLALGELSLLLAYGPLMIGGGYYVIAGRWEWDVVLASLPFALGVSATLLAKHLDRIGMDREARIRTLPVVIGEAPARATLLAMIALQYLITAYLVAIGYFTVVLAVVVVMLPDLFRRVIPVCARPKPDQRPDWYPADRWPLWYADSMFRFTRRFGGWYVFAVVLDTVARLTGLIA